MISSFSLINDVNLLTVGSKSAKFHEIVNGITGMY